MSLIEDNNNTDNNFNNNNNNIKAPQYSTILEENFELKKTLSNLELFINKERSEKEALKNIHEEVKLIQERLRKELQENNSKLINSYSEKITLEKKYEQDINRMKILHEKQIENYQEQLLKLASVDTETLKNKIIQDCDIQYREKLENKDMEIETTKEQMFDYKRKHELLQTEYDSFKLEATKEINFIKENNKAEIRELLFKIQLLSDKNDNTFDKESSRELKNDIDLLRKQNSQYLADLNIIRRDSQKNQIEKNDQRLTLIKEVDENKMRVKVLTADIEKHQYISKSLEQEFEQVKNKLDNKNEEIKCLIEEKFTYAKDLKEKQNDFELIKAEVKVLRHKIEERDNEVNETLKQSSVNEKQRFIQDKNDKEDLMSKIESLNYQLKDVQIEYKNFYEKANDEIHNYKRDYYIISEEKRSLQNRIVELQQDIEYIREDYNRKITSNDYMEKEIGNMQEKYRELSLKEAENHKKLCDMEVSLNSKSKELEDAYKSIVNNNSSGLMSKKYKEVCNKKDFYKNKCKVYNETIKNINVKNNNKSITKDDLISISDASLNN